MDEDTASSNKSSAAGERRALTGLLPQYRAAASLILTALRQRELEFVEIAHDANGAVDDIVIGTAQRIDAYQVKCENILKPSRSDP